MRWFLLVLCLLSAAAAYHYRDLWWPGEAWDGQGNRYHLRVDPQQGVVVVDASIWLQSDVLSMFDVSPIAGLPNGHVDLVEQFEVRDADGDLLSLRDLGMGDYGVAGGRRLALRYRVRLDHARHDWPMGAEEVAYGTDEGWLFRMSTLLFADGGERMLGESEVRFELPEGWQATTPWTATAEAGHFVVPSRRELLSNVVFLGTARVERFEVGGIDLQLVLGRRYVDQADRFRDLLGRQLASYRELFDAAPLGSRYLIVINEGASGDGGAFASSFSQLIPGAASDANRVVWGNTMAHELLHFWNGLSMVPADAGEEWFKEGVTDYLTAVTMARNGLLDRALLFKRLENMERRQVLARLLQGLRMDLREAGQEKQRNRLLVYGGGAVAALRLDAAIREWSGDRAGLPQLMSSMFAEFNQPQQRYGFEDIVRHCSIVAGSDCGQLLNEIVHSGEPVDIGPALQSFGLRAERFAEEIYISVDTQADAVHRARFEAAFAAAAEAPLASTTVGKSIAVP